MWDQPYNELQKEYKARIIPTYVGSTAITGKDLINAANHSHVCGINGTVAVAFTVNGESFPRMWDQRDRRRRIYG